MNVGSGKTLSWSVRWPYSNSASRERDLMRLLVTAFVASAVLLHGPSAAQSRKATVQVQCVAYAEKGGVYLPMLYHTAPVTVLQSEIQIWELNRSWHEVLSKYGYVPSQRAIARCQTLDPRYPGDPIGGTLIDWSPPSNYLPKGTSVSAPSKEARSLAPEPKVEKPTAVPGKKTPNQLKYERELAEHQRILAEREKAIAEAAAKHEANRRAAEARMKEHDANLAQHQNVVAQMERDAAAKRAEWAMRAAGQQPANEDEQPVEFKEGVVLCRQPSPSSKTFNCQGPLQNVSTPLDEAQTQAALGQACGSDRSIRDLGMVKGYRAFGCGFGIHPTARDYPGNNDVPARLGIDFVPGRGSYFCPKSKLAYCRG